VAIGKSQITTKVRTNQIILGICWRSFKVKTRQECVDDLLSCAEKIEESGAQEQKELSPS